MSDFERGAWKFGYVVLGVLFPFGVLWVFLTWPWIVATNNARRHGDPSRAGWTAELIYLAVLFVLLVWGSAARRSRRRIRLQTAGWRHSREDPFGLQRWWDGSVWTEVTQWDFDVVRPNRPFFAHNDCTIRHRTRSVAALHRRLVRER